MITNIQLLPESEIRYNRFKQLWSFEISYDLNKTHHKMKINLNKNHQMRFHSASLKNEIIEKEVKNSSIYSLIFEKINELEKLSKNSVEISNVHFYGKEENRYFVSCKINKERLKYLGYQIDKNGEFQLFERSKPRSLETEDHVVLVLKKEQTFICEEEYGIFQTNDFFQAGNNLESTMLTLAEHGGNSILGPYPSFFQDVGDLIVSIIELDDSRRNKNGR